MNPGTWDPSSRRALEGSAVYVFLKDCQQKWLLIWQVWCVALNFGHTYLFSRGRKYLIRRLFRWCGRSCIIARLSSLLCCFHVVHPLRLTSVVQTHIISFTNKSIIISKPYKHALIFLSVSVPCCHFFGMFNPIIPTIPIIDLMYTANVWK